MREFEIINDSPSPALQVDDVVGIVAGGRKGYLHRMHRNSDRYGLFDMGGPSVGSGWGQDDGYVSVGGALKHINDHGEHVKYYAFESSKDLFRWLGSNQPI